MKNNGNKEKGIDYGEEIRENDPTTGRRTNMCWVEDGFLAVWKGETVSVSLLVTQENQVKKEESSHDS